MGATEHLQEVLLKRRHLLHRHIFEQSIHTAVENGNLLLDRHRRVLWLHKQSGVLMTLINNISRNGVQVATKLGERLQLTVLRLVYFERSRHPLHRLNLGVTTHPRHRDTHINCGSDTLIEEVAGKENLTIGNRNYIGGDICRHIARLGLDNRECRKRAATLNSTFEALGQVVHLLGNLAPADNLRSPLQEARVEVEDVTRVRLPTRGAAQNERHLTISHRLFRQVVIDDQRVASRIAEVLANSRTRKGGKILHCRSVGGCCRHHNSIVHRALLAQSIHNGCHS